MSFTKPLPTIFIDHNEAREDKPLINACTKYYGSQIVTANLSTDFSFYTPKGQHLLERKVFPSDLLASLRDGRLASQRVAMKASAGGTLLLEGTIICTLDGFIKDGTWITKFDLKQLSGLLMSIQDEGTKVIWSPSVGHTPMIIHEAYNWWSKEGHDSIDKRPSLSHDWGRPSKKELVSYAFQGFGVIPKMALRLWLHTGSLRKMAQMSEEELRGIPGIGPSKSKKFADILDAEYKDVFPS